MRVMDTQAYLDNICSLLQQGHTPVSIPVSGNSMCPFLHPGDQVFLEKPQGALKKGDVVLFTRLTGQYVLHRIRKVNPDGSFVMMGDNQGWVETVESAAQIHAKVTAVQRKGKMSKPGDADWWFYENPWRWCALVRRPICRMYGWIKRK